MYELRQLNKRQFKKIVGPVSVILALGLLQGLFLVSALKDRDVDFDRSPTTQQ